MRGKKATQIKRAVKELSKQKVIPKTLSEEPTYNLTREEMKKIGNETLYLTVDCERYWYQKFKKSYKQDKEKYIW